MSEPLLAFRPAVSPCACQSPAARLGVLMPSAIPSTPTRANSST